MVLEVARTTAGRPELLAEAVLSRVRPLTDRLVRTIIANNPGYSAVDVVPEEDLWQSCHDNITRVLQLLAGATTAEGLPTDERMYDAARATGTRRAEQGLPLDDVLRSFRLGGRLIWDALIDEARSGAEVADDGLLEVGGRVWEVVDSTSAHVAAAYHATERQLVRADEQRKVALWEGLLTGRAADKSFAFEAARTLRLPQSGPYVVAAARLMPGYVEVARDLSDRFAERRVATAWHSRSEQLVGILALPQGRVREATGLLRDSCPAPVGLSLTTTAWADAEAAYKQASVALRLLRGQRYGALALQDRMPEALLVDSPELAQRLVDLWLGRVLALPAAQRRPLLDTLTSWVATGGSTGQTAEAVPCHRNTVINRMRRLGEIAGRDLAELPVPVELALAVRACRLLQQDR
jgi:hypothetical protein